MDGVRVYSWEELGVKNHDEAVEYVMDDLKKTLTGMVRAIFGQVKHRPNILSRQPQTFCPKTPDSATCTANSPNPTSQSFNPKPQTLQHVPRIPSAPNPNFLILNPAPQVEMRWVDSYFPFTHPSLELEIYFNGDVSPKNPIPQHCQPGWIFA